VAHIKALGAIAAMTLIFGSRTAAAGSARELGSPSLELSWHSVPECPQKAAGVAAIDQSVDRTQLPRNVQLRLDIEIEAVPEGYSMRVQTELAGRSGERFITAAGCDEFAEAAAVILALALAELHREQQADTTVRRQHVAAKVNATGHDRWLRAWEVVAFSGLTVGCLPEKELTVGLQGRLILKWLGLAAGVRRGMPQSILVSKAHAIGAHFDSWSGDAHVCGLTNSAPFSLGLCAGARVVTVHAEATGTTPLQRRSASRTWLAPTVETLAAYNIIGAFSLELDIGAAWNAAAPEFVITGLGPVHTPEAIAFHVAAGPKLSF
jgi:hypothetical protein